MVNFIKEFTASFDVDPQVGFSPLAPNELPVAGGDEIVRELNAQAEYAKLRVASKDAHTPNGIWIATPDNPQFSVVGTPNVDIRWNRHCEVGTTGFEFLPGLPKPLEYDFVVYKGMENDCHPYGAAYHDLLETRSTGIIEFLKYNRITTVILGGLALDFCVRTTAEQLKKAGFHVIINLAGTRAIAADPKEVIQKMEDRGIEFVENFLDLAALKFKTDMGGE
jgi:nicotinamidase/pyrazinamidase